MVSLSSSLFLRIHVITHNILRRLRLFAHCFIDNDILIAIPLLFFQLHVNCSLKKHAVKINRIIHLLMHENHTFKLLAELPDFCSI